MTGGNLRAHPTVLVDRGERNGAPPETRRTGDMTHEDPKQAFDAAIQLGTLSIDPNASNYAGAFMYMFTDAERGHAFKNIDQRFYVYTGD